MLRAIAPTTGATIFLVDEPHVSTALNLRGTWTHKGEPALVGSPIPCYGETGSDDGPP